MKVPEITDMQTAHIEPLVVDVKALAKMLSSSARSVWRRLAAGDLPKPVRIGRSVRWELAAIHEWIAQGCPKQRGDDKHARIDRGSEGGL